MRVKPIILFHILTVILLSACDSSIKNEGPNEYSNNIKLDSSPRPTFVGDHTVITFNSNVFLLEKEQMLNLSIKNNCLIVNIPQSNDDYLFILNKQQTVIHDPKGNIKGVRDNKTKREISLNSNFNAAGISFTSNAIQFKSKKPTECPDKTIIVGDIL